MHVSHVIFVGSQVLWLESNPLGQWVKFMATANRNIQSRDGKSLKMWEHNLKGNNQARFMRTHAYMPASEIRRDPEKAEQLWGAKTGVMCCPARTAPLSLMNPEA
jgi:hypothetical protein